MITYLQAKTLLFKYGFLVVKRTVHKEFYHVVPYNGACSDFKINYEMYEKLMEDEELKLNDVNCTKDNYGNYYIFYKRCFD